MKIYKFSRVLAIIPGVIFGWFMYKMFTDVYFDYVQWAILPAALLILTYLFQPQIDYWWFSRNPIELDTEIKSLLQKTNPNYNQLGPEEKREFEKRLFLYVEGRDFMSKGYERDVDVVYDVKNMLAQIPVTMTINQKDFLIKAFERIVVYKHAFPSPQYQFLHTLETHLEDGVVLLSLEHLEAAFFNPKEFYNIGYHAYAEAYVKSNPNKEYPSVNEDMWSSIEQISGFTKERILATVGFNSVDMIYVLITLYFTHRAALKSELPNIFSSLTNVFS